MTESWPADFKLCLMLIQFLSLYIVFWLWCYKQARDFFRSFSLVTTRPVLCRFVFSFPSSLSSLCSVKMSLLTISNLLLSLGDGVPCAWGVGWGLYLLLHFPRIDPAEDLRDVCSLPLLWWYLGLCCTGCPFLSVLLVITELMQNSSSSVPGPNLCAGFLLALSCRQCCSCSFVPTLELLHSTVLTSFPLSLPVLLGCCSDSVLSHGRSGCVGSGRQPHSNLRRRQRWGAWWEGWRAAEKGWAGLEGWQYL